MAGYFLSFDDPCAARTALALRQAIWRKDDPRWQVCGIPDVLYTDNGGDFTSRHIEQVAADLKMRLVFSTPDKPRGRGRIERFFATVNQVFLVELPGYAPAGGGRRGQPALTLPELYVRLLGFLLDTYHRREHGETGMAPPRRWEQGGFLPRMPESLEQLDLLLLNVTRERKVHTDGIRFLCRAISPELAGEVVPLRAIVRARDRRRRELRATLREREKTVDTLLELKRGGVEMPAEGRTEEQWGLGPALRRYLNE